MKNYIRTAEDLYEHFHSLSRSSPFHQKNIIKGVYISNKIRGAVLKSVNQGCITLNGRVYTINFENKSCGVWLAFIKDYKINKYDIVNKDN